MPSPAEQGTPDPPGVLVVAGDLVEDVVVWLAEPTRHATDTAARIVRARGGSAANVAAFAAGSGARARFIGCVGADAAGDALAAGLASTGVDVRLQRAGTTGTVVLLVDPDGERTMYPDRGAAAELRRPTDPSWLDGVGWLHVPAYGLEREPARSAVVALADAAREAGAGISLDVSSTGLIETLGPEHFRALVARLAPDIAFANADEAALLGIGSAADAGRPPAPLTIVKRGADPAEVLRLGRPALHVPATAVDDVRDATGAGDAFAAGFLVRAMAGADTGRAATARDALACRADRGKGAMPTPAATRSSAVEDRRTSWVQRIGMRARASASSISSLLPVPRAGRISAAPPRSDQPSVWRAASGLRAGSARSMGSVKSGSNSVAGSSIGTEHRPISASPWATASATSFAARSRRRTRTRGAAARKAPSAGATIPGTTVGIVASVTVSARWWANASLSSRIARVVSCASLRIASARTWNRLAASVGRTSRVVRSKSCEPSASSSLRMRRVTEGCDIPRRSAARWNDPVSLTARNTSRSAKSKLIRITHQSYGNRH